MEKYWTTRLAKEGKPVYAARTEREPYKFTEAQCDAARKRYRKDKKASKKVQSED